MIEISQTARDVTAVLGSIAILVVAIGRLAPFVKAINKLLKDRHKRLKAPPKQTKTQKPNSKTTKPLAGEIPRPWHRRTTFLLSSICFIFLGSQFFSTTVTPGAVAGCVSAAMTIVVIALTELSYLILRSLMVVLKHQLSSARQTLHLAKAAKQMAELQTSLISIVQAAIDLNKPATPAADKKPN